MIQQIDTVAYKDQKMGTSGLRKKVTHFQQDNYLHNFVQSIFNIIKPDAKDTLVIGGDGRYFNEEAIQIIIRIAVANNVGRLVIGQNGILSTPAASIVIRELNATGGIILSASHNPAGENGDFGIKYNAENGGPANEALTTAFYEESMNITSYRMYEGDSIDLSDLDSFTIDNTHIDIVDSISTYAKHMEALFDFDVIREAIKTQGLCFQFDAMHAVTGPYAKHLFVNMLGVDDENVFNAIPLKDFNGQHPDPSQQNATELINKMRASDINILGAASDGDGDRNMIVGNDFFVSPSDSLAVIVANAHLIKGYKDNNLGVARSMPTSSAADNVANKLGLDCFITPTGWKFFGNLLDADKITFCGEESFGTGSNHAREKDGLWAVLFWLNLIAIRQKTPREVMLEHWATYGRNYYTRHDFDIENVETAHKIFEKLSISGYSEVENAHKLTINREIFNFTDPVDGSTSENQGLIYTLSNGASIKFRLSGTGTTGATLRVYMEDYEEKDFTIDTQHKLEQVIGIAHDLMQLEKYGVTGKPASIT